MEVCIERHDGAPVALRVRQDLVVGGGRHPDVARVDGVKANSTQLDHGEAG